MCTNFTPTRNQSWLKERFGITIPSDQYPLEVYPGSPSPFLIKSLKSGEIKCGLAEFGLIPGWAKDKKIQRFTYNARSETVLSKPSFKYSWSNRRFGICLVDGFYEPNYESGKAVRWCIERQDKQPIAIASLWDVWVYPDDGQKVVSFTMLTCNSDSHPVMNRFHKTDEEKRTPVILNDDQILAWLTITPDNALHFMNCNQFPPLITSPAPTKPVRK